MTQTFRIAPSTALKLALAAGLFSLAGCAGAGDDVARSVGLMRDAPDEFVVTTRAPLAMPSDLNTLPPPTPGAPRPQEQSTRDAAQLTLAPQSVASNSAAAPTTGGEQALLKASGPASAPDIRNDVDHLAVEDQDQRGLLDKLMFWKTKPEPGVVVNAPLESQRIRQNAALGKSDTDGPTPIQVPQSSVGRDIAGNVNQPGQETSAPDAQPTKHWWNIF
jgi:hypothetical protein